MAGTVNAGKITTPKATLSPTFDELVWAAGWLEGEGTFRKKRGYKLPRHISGPSELVSAEQVNPWPVRRCQALFGGSVKLVDRSDLRRKGRGAQDIWHWEVSGARARGVMMTLFHLLSPVRRNQIQTVLAA